MKAALLSFHNGCNYGAALQAYALQEAVAAFGVDCEYINYVNAHRKELYDMRARFRKAIRQRDLRRAVTAAVGAPLMHRRSRWFKRFYAEYLRKTDKVYRSSDEARELNGVYDKFIVGSDQVWNVGNNGSDTAFLLDFVEEDSKRISYSSSFGMNRVPDELASDYAENLRRFAHISVRELEGVRLVRELAGRDAHLVTDPVFLLGRDKWESLSKGSDGGYVFAYMDSDSELKDFERSCPEARGKKVHLLCPGVGPRTVLDPRIKLRLAESVESFLGEILHAEHIVTDSFHCIAFALIFERPFTAFLSGNRGKDERLVNLLSAVGLADRIFDPEKPTEYAPGIDFAPVRSKLSAWVDYSLRYLKNALTSDDDIPHEDFTPHDSGGRVRPDSGCTGCTACVNACPKGAIQMEPGYDGFLYPHIDNDICVDCGVCRGVCDLYLPRRSAVCRQEYLAVKCEDAVRECSSSGGAFTLISDRILGKGGTVFAAVYDRSTHSLSHKAIADAASRDSARGTYYIQSDLGLVFSKVKETLDRGEEALFMGTPCQVSGLRNFVGEREGLYCCDIICHGAASPGLYSRFIDWLGAEDFKFRDKRVGWRGYTESAVIRGKYKKSGPRMRSFGVMYSHNMVNRLSCASCRFTDFDRVGDVTIGDYWGVEKVAPQLDDGLGVSLVIINNEKGRSLLDGMEFSRLGLTRENCVQNSLVKPAAASRHRNAVFAEAYGSGFGAAAKKYGEYNFTGLIKNGLRRLKTAKMQVRRGRRS